MLYLRMVDGQIEYPYDADNIKRNNPNTSFPREWSPELLAEYGVFQVGKTPQPRGTETHMASEIAPVLEDGAWRQQWEMIPRPPKPVPSVITPRQCRLVLMAQGLLPKVEEMIAGQDEATRITWEYALEFRRDDPLLAALAAGLGLTDDQIDEFFIAATAI